MSDGTIDLMTILDATLRDAQAALARRDNDEAARLFGQVAREGAESRALQPLAARALVELGWLDEGAGRWRQAAERFAEGESLAVRAEAHEAAVEARIGAGVVRLHRRDIPKALASFEAAVKEAKRRNLPDRSDRAAVHLAQAHSLSGRHREAEAELRAILARLGPSAASADPSSFLVETRDLALARLAALLFRARRADAAERLLAEHLEAPGPAADSVQTVARAECFRYLGIVRSVRLAHPEALEAYEKALTILKPLGHVPAFARLYASVGRSCYLACDLARAQFHFEKARTLAVTLDLRSNAAEFASMLGHIAFRRERYEEALAFYTEDHAITAELDDRLARGYARRNLGAVCVKLGRLGLAAGHLAEAERLFRDAGSVPNLAIVHIIQAEKSLAAGETVEARTRAETAERLFASIGKAGEFGSCERILGEIEAAEGRLPAACTRLERACATLRARNDLFPLLDALEAHARTLDRAGRPSDAVAALDEAVALAQRHDLARTRARLERMRAECRS